MVTVVSSFSSVQSPPQNQVFLNFRGKQLRNGFVSHLEKADEGDYINQIVGEVIKVLSSDLERHIPIDNHPCEFLRCVFLHDVRKLWKDCKMNRDIFMRELLKDDDVKQEVSDLSPESLKALLLSSRIFITTSDKSVIEGVVDDTYEVLRLSGRDSFQYFSYFAFSGKLCPPEDNFLNLSRLFVDYAKGNPLALKILSVELSEKDETH
ncbi:unnamed protein product [Brassica oleracea]